MKTKFTYKRLYRKTLIKTQLYILKEVRIYYHNLKFNITLK